MKNLLIAILVFIPTLGLSAEKLVFTGEVFDKSGTTKKFDFERYTDVQGNKVLGRAVFKDLDGEVLVEEKAEIVDGNLVRYDIDQKQLKQKAWIEVKGEKAIFNLKKFRKSNYPIEAKLPENFMVGFQIVPTVQKHWDAFAKGTPMKIGYGVWHRQESVGFTLSKEKMDDKELVIKMNPTSFLIRAVVNPIYFHFNKKTKELTSYVGRVVPKEKRGRDYYDYDGMVRYKTVSSDSTTK